MRSWRFFRARLRQMEADIRNNAGETTEHLRETVIVPDPADRATIEEEHALELRTRDRERKLLKKIEQALATIDSGDYGYCEETGDPSAFRVCWHAPRHAVAGSPAAARTAPETVRGLSRIDVGVAGQDGGMSGRSGPHGRQAG